MRTIRAIVAVLAGLLWASTGTAADDFVVIVHPDNPVSELARAETSDFFLKKKLHWQDGTKVEAIDLPPSSPVRTAFSLSVHKRSTSAVQNFWQRQIFSGRNVPPARGASDAEVIAFVRVRPGAIGYVAPTSVTGEVKVVAIEDR